MPTSREILFSQAAIRLDPRDPLAVARQNIAQGTRLHADRDDLPFKQLEALQEIPAGHKIALAHIPCGSGVYKYGQHIGVATQEIHPGEWLHTHNLDVGDMTRRFEMRVVGQTSSPPNAAAEIAFTGFPRPDGRFGTRNSIAVISTVSCSAQTALAIANAFPRQALAPFPQVDAVIPITHSTGCSIPAGSLSDQYLKRCLLNLIHHPNVGGVVFVSLGCEVNQMAALVDSLRDGLSGMEIDRLAARPIGPFLTIQEEGGMEKTVQKGIQAVQAMLPVVNQVRRTPAPLSALTVALQCGGSDAWSGITANPLIGRISDRVVRAGGTVVLSETPEIYGAEQLLLQRVVSKTIGRKLIRRIQWWQAQARLLDFSLDNNPSPGNKTGGLTTIYEKSLGAVSKAGSTPLVEVYDYAETVSAKGMVYMDTPGNDPISVTGQVSGGCNLVLFTTGRGSVFGGTLAPCIKIASNTQTYQNMTSDMDFNAGEILEGLAMENAESQLMGLVLQIASGAAVKSEQNPMRSNEFVPWQPSGVL